MANWTREQLLVAINLYCELDFGKFHKDHPRIIELATQIGRTPSALAMKLCNLASLDPAITASGRKGLDNASAQDRAIWQEFREHPDAVALESQDIVDKLAPNNALVAAADEGLLTEESASYLGLTATALVTVRRKQNFFRKAVLSGYENRCCMSGISHPRLLIASHIVPWAKDENNRLNPANGLCLSALHDRAFDQGLLTVTPALKIRVSDVLRDTEKTRRDHATLLALHDHSIAPPHKLSPHPDFLAYHNQHVFLG